MPITTWAAEAIIRAAQGTALERMNRAVIVVRDQVKVLSNRGNPTGKNPSAPGEPPKKVSGRFVNSLATETKILGNGDVVGLIGSNVPYQPRLELGFSGTDARGHVYHQAPRPAFVPALNIARPKITQIFGG
jgi:hypothetical protein